MLLSVELLQIFKDYSTKTLGILTLEILKMSNVYFTQMFFFCFLCCMLIIYKTNLEKYNKDVMSYPLAFEFTTSELHILKPGEWQDTRIPGGGGKFSIYTR